MPYKLLFVDIDGTLVGHDDVPSPRTVRALRAVQEAGCTVVVCTGRHRHSVEPIIAHWAPAAGSAISYGAYCNGAVLVDRGTGRTLHKLDLPAATVRHASRLATDCGLAPLLYGVHVEEDGGLTIYRGREHSIHPAWADQNGHRVRYLEAVDESVSPVDMGVFGAEEATCAVAEAWRLELGADVIVYCGPEPRFGVDCWAAFLNNRAADKAHAAMRVAEMLGVPREETMAIGDHLNDAKLLRWAGLGICMGDGHEDAKVCAGHITGTLAEDGAAQAIERFVLGLSGAF
jgi:hypothetical protein